MSQNSLNFLKRYILTLLLFFNTILFVYSQNINDTSIAMLNYLATQTRMINSSHNNRLMLEDIYNKLINNTNPGIVDETTQRYLQILLDDIERFRIITLQRERLQFFLENQRAHAINNAMPNPLYLLGLTGPGGLKTINRSSTTAMSLAGSLSGSLSGILPSGQAGNVSGNISGSYSRTLVDNITRTISNPMKLIATVSIMTLDSALKYKSALNDANLEFLQENWELDDKESSVIHNLRSYSFSYMIEIARKNRLGIFDTLNEESIDNFVSISLDNNLERRRQSLESHLLLYQKYAPYYIELAKTYYDLEMYNECINAINNYEKLKAPIFRKDFDFASVLPKAIIAVSHIYNYDDIRYTTLTDKYSQDLIYNTNSSNWELRYFAAQTYINLAALDEKYLTNAYNLLLDNITYLSRQQEIHLENYLKPINEKINKGLTKEQEKKANTMIKELQILRKTELPPLYNALIVNHQTLLLLLEEFPISEQERFRINAILDKSYVNPSFRSHYFNKEHSFTQSDFLLKGSNFKSLFDIIKIVLFIIISSLPIVMIFAIIIKTRSDKHFANFIFIVFGLFLNVFLFNLFFDFIPINKIPTIKNSTVYSSIHITLPAIYLSSNSILDVKVTDNDQLYSEQDIKYQINAVQRKNKNEINLFKADISFNLDTPLLIRKNQENIIYLTITTNGIPLTLIFTSPEYKTNFKFTLIQ